MTVPATPTPTPTPTPETPPTEGTPPAAAAPALTPPEPGSPLGAQPEPKAGEEPKPGEGEQPKAEEFVAPDYKFEVPEGLEISDETLGAFKSLAAEAKLDQAAADKFLGMHTQALQSTVESIANAQAKAWEDTITGWKTEFESDPTFGGDNKAATLTAIGKALDEYGTPEARQAFDVTGAGWNPHIIRFVAKMAQALSEGSQVPPGGPTTAKGQTLGQRLYG